MTESKPQVPGYLVTKHDHDGTTVTAANTTLCGSSERLVIMAVVAIVVSSWLAS
jgi:hypothetical protein